MGVAAVAVQQAILQSNVTLAVIKQNVKAQQSLAELVASTVDSARGQNLDVTV